MRDIKGCPEWETALLETAWTANTPASGFAAHLNGCEACRSALEAEWTLATRAREAAPVPVPDGVADGLTREIFARTTRHDAERRRWLFGGGKGTQWGGWAATLTATAAALIAVTRSPVPVTPTQPDVPGELLELTDVDLELLEELDLAEEMDLLELLDLLEEMDDA